MRSRNLDALFVSGAANRFYLSGFELHDSQPNESSGYLVITGDGRDWLATDSRYTEAAARLWPRDNIFVYGANATSALAGLLSRCGGLIGIEPGYLSLKFVEELQTGKKPGTAFVAGAGLVEKLREIKEPEEIRALDKSFRLNHAMLEWLRAEVEQGNFEGIPEKALAWEIEKFFRENGAQELAFSTIAAAGKNGSLPHAIPGDDLVPANGPLLVDAGCRVDCYCSDQTRTWWTGKNPSREFQTSLDLVRKAQEAAIAAIRPGMACAEIYRIAADVFEQAGVKKAFTHGLGHGVGLETHEAPSLSAASRQKLTAGMVVTVEPGLYYPEWGGIRWEYTVVVEEDGARIL